MKTLGKAVLIFVLTVLIVAIFFEISDDNRIIGLSCGGITWDN